MFSTEFLKSLSQFSKLPPNRLKLDSKRKKLQNKLVGVKIGTTGLGKHLTLSRRASGMHNLKTATPPFRTPKGNVRVGSLLTVALNQKQLNSHKSIDDINT